MPVFGKTVPVSGKKGGIRARYEPGLFFLFGLFMVWSHPRSAAATDLYPEFISGV